VIVGALGLGTPLNLDRAERTIVVTDVVLPVLERGAPPRTFEPSPVDRLDPLRADATAGCGSCGSAPPGHDSIVLATPVGSKEPNRVDFP